MVYLVFAFFLALLNGGVIGSIIYIYDHKAGIVLGLTLFFFLFWFLVLRLKEHMDEPEHNRRYDDE